jgi:hypothetical protein
MFQITTQGPCNILLARRSKKCLQMTKRCLRYITTVSGENGKISVTKVDETFYLEILLGSPDLAQARVKSRYQWNACIGFSDEKIECQPTSSRTIPPRPRSILILHLHFQYPQPFRTISPNHLSRLDLTTWLDRLLETLLGQSKMLLMHQILCDPRYQILLEMRRSNSCLGILVEQRLVAGIEVVGVRLMVSHEALFEVPVLSHHVEGYVKGSVDNGETSSPVALVPSLVIVDEGMLEAVLGPAVDECLV